MSSEADDGDVECVAVAPSSLDWDKLFKLAEDPDMDEILRGPLETAIKNLEEGKEVHKLQAIRSFPDLLESDGDECMQKLLPAIQKTLKEEKSNLDIHCEAAVVFKGVLQNDKLCNMFPGLIDTLLESILQNITSQKDNLSAAAWLETLVDVAERISLDAIKQYIVPVVQQQAEPVQRVQRRIIATKLLHKLANILPSNEVRKELGPCAQMLCQDANANVRTAMAQRLPVIAKALKNATDTVSLLLPCFVQLCKDDDATVREACMNNLAPCLPHFTKDAKKSTIFPLIKKCTEQSIEKKDDILMVIAKNLGEWAHCLAELLDQLDLSWVLNVYLKVVSISQTATPNTPGQSLLTMCKRMSAFNLPCMVELFPKAFDRILPVFEAFCNDSDDEVRLAMASSYHEILLRNPDRVALLQPFMELIRGGAPEVVSKLTRNLDKMLPILYKLAADSNGKVSTVQLDRILIGCNQLLRGTGSWRGHDALLRHLAVLRSVLSFKQLHDTFVPLLQREVKQVRALPCRISAATTLLLFMREQPEKERRTEIIEFFRLEISHHPCCYRRALFLDVVEVVLKTFSRRFFVEHFLIDTVRMTEDSVSNIRLKAIRLLPRIKSFLILPEDDGTLLELEKSVREALTSEKQQSTRQLLQTAACELSRCDAKSKKDKEDQKKCEEEERLWDEKRVKELEEKSAEASPSRKSSDDGQRTPKPSGLRPPETPRAVSPWRSQRRAVAVVRPQPVVIMRSASPAPKSLGNGKPSRLPLSTTSKDRESLKRATMNSALPRPSRSSSEKVMSTSASAATDSKGTTPGYGLQRSATSSSGFGRVTTSSSSYPLMSSRSASTIRRPTYGLTRVSSQSTMEKKPSHVSMKVRANI